jgi:hypothetical protein
MFLEFVFEMFLGEKNKFTVKIEKRHPPRNMNLPRYVWPPGILSKTCGNLCFSEWCNDWIIILFQVLKDKKSNYE